MDQKKSTQLDPKLKEIYDRVMGTSTAPTSNTATTPAENPMPVPTAGVPSPEPATVPVPAMPAPIPTPDNTTPPTVPVRPASTFNNTPRASFNSPQEAPAAITTVKPRKAKGKLPSVVWITGLIIFLIGYAFIWIKVFNLKLP